MDEAAEESKRCVHLLDEELEIGKVGLASEKVCQIAATAVCETAYRGAAKLITEATGLISVHRVFVILRKGH